MKTKQQKKNTYTHLEKIVGIAGLPLIVIGCAASLYSAYASRNFIHDPVDLIYYLRYIILLGGGFTAGYLLTKKSGRKTQYGQLFLGVAYAALTMAIYWLFEIVRVSLQTLLGLPSFPWGKIMFMGMPLLALLATFAVAYFSQRRANRAEASSFAKAAALVSFAVYELHALASGIYLLITGSAAYDPDATAWSIAGSYLTAPLVIAAVSYLLLGGVKKRLDRLFYAALTGLLYSTLTLVLWEFRVDASYDATNNFSSGVTAVTLIFAAAVLWQMHKATASK